MSFEDVTTVYPTYSRVKHSYSAQPYHSDNDGVVLIILSIGAMINKELTLLFVELVL